MVRYLPVWLKAITTLVIGKSVKSLIRTKVEHAKISASFSWNRNRLRISTTNTLLIHILFNYEHFNTCLFVWKQIEWSSVKHLKSGNSWAQIVELHRLYFSHALHNRSNQYCCAQSLTHINSNHVFDKTCWIYQPVINMTKCCIWNLGYHAAGAFEELQHS